MINQKNTHNSFPTHSINEISGLPHSLSQGTIVELIKNGSEIALATGDSLMTFRLTPGSKHFTAVQSACYSLPGRACAIAESNLGTVIAVEKNEHSVLYLARDNQLASVYEIPGTIMSLVTGGSQTYAVVRTGEGMQARLVHIDLRQREIVSERQLDHSKVKLSLDSDGQRLILSDPVSNKVVTLGPRLQRMSIIPTSLASVTLPEETGREKELDHSYPHNQGCCCIVCKPSADGTRSVPPRPIGQEESQQPKGMVSGHDGQTGVSGPGGGTIVGNGGRVVNHSSSDDHRPPCEVNVFWMVASLQRSGPYLLASDRSSQNIALLSTDMDLLNEWKFGRGGVLLLAAEETSTFIMHLRGSGKWMYFDVHEVASAKKVALERFVLQPLDSKIFVGQTLYPMSLGIGAPTSINAVLLPVIEGDQSFSSADLSGFGAFVHRAMETVVRDYYQENSFNLLKDVSIKIFGIDIGPTGCPLKLPRKKIADYYWPEYIPAKLELVKSGVSTASKIVFDGRESLTIEAKPLTSGPSGGLIKFPFYALALQVNSDLMLSSQVKFLGTEKLKLEITTAAGTVKTLNLVFKPKTFTFDTKDPSSIAAQLVLLGSYLDGVMKAAELAAGITSRLFTSPNVYRIQEIGKDFGRLLVTFSAADTTGKRLMIRSAIGTSPGGDPIGLKNPILGTMNYSDTGALTRYFENAALLGQDAAIPKFDYTNRILKPPSCAFDSAASKLTTTIPIADRIGGPGAEVNLKTKFELDALFESAFQRPNSETTWNNRQTIRDFDDFLKDAFSAAVERLTLAGLEPNTLKTFGTVLVMPVEQPTPKFGVTPSENWNITPLYRPFYLRGMEGYGTIIDRKNKSIQVQATCALIFMKNEDADLNISVACHELGHTLGFGDLYKETGYRDELKYLNEWAMMSADGYMSHHCGYHKLQANWIPSGAGTAHDYGRVLPFGLPEPATTVTKEMLLVPIEIWRDSLITSARTAFGVPEDFPVGQLMWIDFGGDGATFGLIEARESAKNSSGHLHFSKNIPGNGGILITNGIAWHLDDRFAVNNFYRRPCQLLNPNNILRNSGDQFDLSLAPELPVKGMKVELIDRKTVESDTEVYRIKVSRENAEFVDLYFADGDPYYKSPDLWVDWWRNNKPEPKNFNPDYTLGQPLDQGETVFVPSKGAEPHWVVARLRNRGKVKALDVKINFYYMDPPGGGDGGKPLNTMSRKGLKLIDTSTGNTISGGDLAHKIPVQWNVPAGFSGHTCILVEIEDYKIPSDAKGGALGSEDVWQVNNHAQKNVDNFQALSGSPFAPIEFDFSVYNAGVCPEIAYLEPEGLSYGMTLTVTPSRQTIGSEQTVLFHCKLELNEKIILTGCQNDKRFRIHAWRQDPESSARWGGVEYEIQPREKTAVTLKGTWHYSNMVELTGTIAPYPGGGSMHLRLAFDNQQVRWVTVSIMTSSAFAWSEFAPKGSTSLNVIAWFEGNRKFGSSRSAPIDLNPPPPIR